MNQLAGFLVALAIALAARRAGSLSTSGAIAATIVGALAMAAGWQWGALLVIYFVASAMLSRFKDAEKQKRTATILDKPGPRDAVQVVANGGIFAVCALLAQYTSVRASFLLSAASLGALAAATADTWATERGTLSHTEPRSILSWKIVPAGTSGGVTPAGLVATVAGAVFIALIAESLGLGTSIAAVIAGGIAGAVGDSVLGATVQGRRWCVSCQLHTEQLVHVCGQQTTLASGREWLDNDLVNLLCTLIGAAVAAVVASL